MIYLNNEGNLIKKHKTKFTVPFKCNKIESMELYNGWLVSIFKITNLFTD